MRLFFHGFFLGDHGFLKGHGFLKDLGITRIAEPLFADTVSASATVCIPCFCSLFQHTLL